MTIKHSLLGAALLLAATSPAFAHKPAPVDNSQTPWNGVYAGLDFGVDLGTTDRINDTGADVGETPQQGVNGGGVIGYNYQYGRYIFGVEADGSGDSDRAGHACVTGTYRCEVDTDWFVTLRPRLGYVFGDFMPYVTTGLAVASIHASRTAALVVNNETDAQTGIVAGLGGEYMFASQWSAKAEYLYIDYADAHSAATLPGGINYTIPYSTNIVRVGINYHFW